MSKGTAAPHSVRTGNEPTQLTLALDTAPATSFSTFHADDGLDSGRLLASRSIEAFASGELDEQQLYVWGEAGAGKSHLLTAACRRVGESGLRVAYVPGELANQPSALEGLESCGLVCIDDLQRLDHGAETDLFHCINRCRAADTRLLFAADRTVERLGLILPDLATRLNWGPVFHIEPLAGVEILLALRREFESRSLSASDELLSWIVRRYPRDMRAMKELVDQLDQASLSEKRRLTVPFVRQVVEAAGTDGV